MLTQKLVTQYLLATATLLAVGCSSGGDDKKAVAATPDDVSEYAKASCEYKYEEGGRAPTQGANDVRSTYFKKNLNFALLNPVLGASGGETVRFAESHSVRYYKTSFRSTSNCEFTQALPAAPSDLSAEFSKNDSQGAILGLYLGANTKNLPSTTGQASILVRRDANKWVLVHEYTHHLFQLQRDAEMGVQTEDIKTRLVRVGKEYDQAMSDLKADRSTDRAPKLKAAAQKLVEFNGIAFDFLREYLLEEMSIENVLAEKFERSELKYVIAGQRINGAAYTISSGKKAKEQFLSALSSDIDQFLMIYRWDMASEDLSQVQKLQTEISSMTSEIDTLAEKAKAFLRTKGLEYKGLGAMGIAGSTETNHIGCTHEQGVEEVEQFFKQRRH